jgi:predicted CoA-binding protein
VHAKEDVMPDRKIIEEFLAQEHVAFVGVSRDTKQFANAVYRRLKEGGRTLYPVNPAAEGGPLEGDRSYQRLADVPDPVDGVVVMVPASSSAEVVRQAVERGIPRVWLHRGAGKGSVSPEAVQVCRDHGVAVVDGACPLMFDEPVGGVHRLHRLISGRRIAA